MSRLPCIYRKNYAVMQANGIIAISPFFDEPLTDSRLMAQIVNNRLAFYVLNLFSLFG